MASSGRSNGPLAAQMLDGGAALPEALIGYLSRT